MRFIHHNPQLNKQYPNLDAYRAAWDKCLAQVKNIVENIYAPSIAAISASNDSLLGLPYPELPLIAINNATSSSLFITGVISSLTNDGSIAIHLYHSDIPNLPTAMKNLISSFIDSLNPSSSSDSKRKSTRSAATYDIRILCAWYTKIKQEYGNIKLIVVLHDFEQFDVTVMQELFAICSRFIQQLPLLFITLLSSPPLPSYIHSVYPRTTLARLRVDSFSIPSGPQVLEQIILKTFFNLDFEPDLMLGPTILSTIVNYITRNNSSVDTLITMLQLTHLKHFLIEPLSIFTPSTPYSPNFNNIDPNILDLLTARLNLLSPNAPISEDEIKIRLKKAQTQFQIHLRHIRISFHLLHLIQTFFESNGYKGLGWNINTGGSSLGQGQGQGQGKGMGLTSVMISILRGRMNRDIQTLNLLIRKLRPTLLQSLLSILNAFFSTTLSSKLRKQILEEQVRIKLVMFRTTYQFPDAENQPEGGSGNEGKEIADWLCDYLTQLIKIPESLELWDIWYTGMMPFPIEMINPNIKSTILSGLTHPYDFIQPLPLPSSSTLLLTPNQNRTQTQNHNQNHKTTSQTQIENENNKKMKQLWDNPDTTILYRLYQDSGKLINVNDWYEAFRGILGSKRDYLRSISRSLSLSQQPSKSKGNGKSKEKGKGKGKEKSPSKVTGKGKGKPTRDDLEIGEEEEEEQIEQIEENEETWDLETQSRFLRSLHELDHLGFIKHTGRRVEHVVRNVFDVRDDDDDDDDDNNDEEGEGEGGGESGVEGEEG